LQEWQQKGAEIVVLPFLFGNQGPTSDGFAILLLYLSFAILLLYFAILLLYLSRV
jgi:hypothetical protein